MTPEMNPVSATKHKTSTNVFSLQGTGKDEPILWAVR